MSSPSLRWRTGGDMAAEIGRIIRTQPSTPCRRSPDLDASSGQKLIAPQSCLCRDDAQSHRDGDLDRWHRSCRSVLSVLPRQTPGIVMTQHMPEGFTATFAAGLNEQCEIEVREAKDGDSVLTGLALWPGNKHMRLARDGAGHIVRVTDGPRVQAQALGGGAVRSTAEHAGGTRWASS